MASYIDSSFLLSIILEENLSSRTINVWQNEDIRVSSILLRAECIITLRRIHFNYKNKLPETWLKEKEIELNNLLQEVTLRIFDKSILDIIEIKKVLSNCRTLDAIHLATAIDFKDNFGDKLYICSFDKNMRRISKKAGFNVLPEKL
jgi:predicted nucleic acid-binding protein